MKKQSSDWSSSGWDADDSWSNEKDTDGQGQSSPADEGWGNDWEDDGALAESFTPTPRNTASAFLPKSTSTTSGQEGLRLTSDYNWDSSGAKGTTSDLFSGMSQRAGSASAATVRKLYLKECMEKWNQVRLQEVKIDEYGVCVCVFLIYF